MRRLAAGLALLGLFFAAFAAHAQTAAKPAEQRTFAILPIFESAGVVGTAGFSEADLQTEMTSLKRQIGQNRGPFKVGFSHIFHENDSLPIHCRLARDNNLSIGVIMAVQTHTNAEYNALAEKDFRRYQWRLDGKTWQGDNVVGKAGNVEFPPRDWEVATPSRYCAAIHDAAMLSTRTQARLIRHTMNDFPGVIVAVNGAIEEELATGGEARDGLLADYSPYAVTEFRDWLRHTGKYDDLTGEYPGQGAPAEIVGPLVRIKGALRSPFYDDPNPSKSTGTGLSFNARFGTHFSTWTLRDWDLDRFPAPITDKNFIPAPDLGPGFTDGGFDAPRKREPTDAYWRAWSWDVYDQGGKYPPGSPDSPAFGFRQFEVAHFVSDVLNEARKAGIPAEMLYAHQIPAEVVSPSRCRSGADPIWSGLYAPGGTLGITRFGPIDPAKLTQYSRNWGIFEWHPLPNAKPNDPKLYAAAKQSLDSYYAAGARVLLAGWWKAGGQNEPVFPLNDSQFALAIHDWLAVH